MNDGKVFPIVLEHAVTPDLQGRYTRGILLPEHAPGARSASKAPPCVPTISWVYFTLGSSISTPQIIYTILNRLNIWEKAPGAPGAN